MNGWREFAMVSAAQCRRIETSDALGDIANLGHGWTAYAALTRAVRIRPTDTVFVSSAAGAIGSMAGQIARLLGARRVIGSTSSQRKADWLVGAGLWAKGIRGKALRSLKAPGTAYDDPRLGKDPQPANMKDYVDTADDNGGVHINSGIPNHAFYLASIGFGGKAWMKAGKVWYLALTQSLHRDADFLVAAAATVDAAGRLFGTKGAYFMPRKPGSPLRAHSMCVIFGARPTKGGTAGSMAPCTLATSRLRSATYRTVSCEVCSAVPMPARAR